LQKQIEWIENHIQGSSNNNAKADNLKQIKQELVELLEEDLRLTN
jgi:hypothetical protein